jgi:hypothetical protein
MPFEKSDRVSHLLVEHAIGSTHRDVESRNSSANLVAWELMHLALLIWLARYGEVDWSRPSLTVAR